MLHRHVGQRHWGNMVGDGGNMVAESVGTCCMGPWGRGTGGIWSGMGGIWLLRVSVHAACARGAGGWGEYGWGWGEYGRGECRYMSHGHVGWGDLGNMVGDGGSMVMESVGTCCIGRVGQGDAGNMVGDGGNMVTESVGTCCVGAWVRGMRGIWSGMGGIWSRRVSVHVAWPRGAGAFREYGRG